MARVSVRRALLAVSVVAALAACSAGCSAGSGPSGSTSTRTASASASTTASPVPSTASSSTATARPTATPTPRSSASAKPTAAAKRAAHTIAGLTDGLGRHGVSVAARDLSTGATFTTGATSGMYEGSIAKLDIIETLLLRHQARHTAMTDRERDLATAMIEHSDNDAANNLWTMEGGRTAVAAANKVLGLQHTKPGPGIYWGFSTTSARDQLALLGALVAKHGPLTTRSQHYILGLMRNVEADQRWGVATVADHPSTAALKNGWLANSLDDGRWLVNSLGIVRRDGHTLLMAVLTQHGGSFAGGITLDEKIARATLPALR